MKTTIIAFAAIAALLPTAIIAADPESPAPGAIRRVYAIHANNVGSDHVRWFQAAVDSILGGRIAPYSTEVDSSSTGFRILSGNELGMWQGWIKCTKSGEFTIVINRTSTLGNPGWYLCSLWVNGSWLFSARRGSVLSVKVQLKAGYNEIKMISEGSSNIDNHISMSFKRSDSTKQPSVLSPGSLWHDNAVEEDNEEEEDWVPANPTTTLPAPKPAPKPAQLNWQDYITDFTP